MQKLVTTIKRFTSFVLTTVFRRTERSVTLHNESGGEVLLYPVSHHLDSEEIEEGIITIEGDVDVTLVEGSLYLGGFLPEGARREKIIVMLEPPSLFVDSDAAKSLLHIYLGGYEIPESSRGLRRLLETMATEISSSQDSPDVGQLASELLYLRRKHPDAVIFNEPQAWLRTVWYEADLLFYYLTKRVEIRLFGALLYSEMDTVFLKFIQSHAKAINAMTGPYCLLFAFDSSLGKQAELYENSQYVMYRSIIERQDRFENEDGAAKTAADLDALREEEAAILSEIDDLNRSILFADRIGVRREQTPCVAFWEDLESKDILVFSFAEFQEDPQALRRAFKSMTDIISDETRDGSNELLSRLNGRFHYLQGQLRPSHFQTSDAVGELTRAFLLGSMVPQVRVEISQEVIMGDKVQGDKVEGKTRMGDTFNMSGDFRGAILSIRSTLNNVSQSIGQIPDIDPSAKEELKELLNRLNETLQQVPPDKTEEAEAVAESAKQLVETATKEKTNKAMVQISAEGLKLAAKNIAEVMPAVLAIATQIIGVILKLVG